MQNDSLTVSFEPWLPPDPGPEPPRRPAKWDGRPFPGKCSVEGCAYQATSSMGSWTGGAPGAGEFVVRGHCIDHLEVEY